jgi:hypothetical protein
MDDEPEAKSTLTLRNRSFGEKENEARRPLSGGLGEGFRKSAFCWQRSPLSVREVEISRDP